MLYPKINSLYKREGCGHFDESRGQYVCDLDKKPRKSPLIEGLYACEEFPNINKWSVTEKIDGTNVRIILDKKNQILEFKGRTENAQFPTFLYAYLQRTFTYSLLNEQFDANYVVLFGEGYGPKIQSGGYYRKDVSFILFDVCCGGFWLTREGVKGVAEDLGINSVPVINNPNKDDNIHWNLEEIVDYVKRKPNSIIAQEEHESEGIMARSEPPMLFRNGSPIMFKLKCKDFT